VRDDEVASEHRLQLLVGLEHESGHVATANTIRNIPQRNRAMTNRADDFAFGPEIFERLGHIFVGKQIESCAAPAGHVDRVVLAQIHVAEFQRILKFGRRLLVRVGRFELAHGGTIFLDEVGDLPPETQVALLRVLQEHEFERVGGTRKLCADVRVIAATNRDLQAAIRSGSFRSDLFYRLHVFPMPIPPLRDRQEDIPLLVEYFIDRYARKAGKRIRDISKKTLELLQSYPWPGNIRELQNVIERSVLLCETESFSIDESWLSQQPPPAESKEREQLPLKLLAQEKKAAGECSGRKALRRSSAFRAPRWNRRSGHSASTNIATKPRAES